MGSRMKYLYVALVLVGLINLTGCTGAQVRVSGQVPDNLINSSVAMVSNDALSEALTGEMINCGVKMIERSRLISVLDELHLSTTGILEKENTVKLGKILNVDLLVFIKSAYHFNIIESATVRMVDIKTGQVVVAVNYSNRRGVPLEYAQTVSESAQSIARELVNKFGKSCK